ncbi:MAG TPA: nucleotide exchange factor GrpE [Candidatus Hydrogenedentes bacterium]|nr:nucleotide exchange factor GrpE [Candidatus Hydrogenedentota bacterium]
MKKDVKHTEAEEQPEAQEAEETNGAEEPGVPESAPEPEAPEPPEDPAAALTREVESLTQERDTLKDQMLRLRAEFDNSKKRNLREMERIRKTAAEGLIQNLLPVLDNLERALDHKDNASDEVSRGIELILGQFRAVMAGAGLEAIPAQGVPFDPKVHEALSCIPSEDHPADTVLEECLRGYRIGEYVIRPAKVIVSKGPAVEETTPEEIETM